MPDPRPESEPDPPHRRPTFGDLRDDYDDDFGIVRSPREIAKRRLLAPGIAHVAIGALGIPGMMAAIGAVIVAHFEARRPDPIAVLAIYVSLLVLAGCLFGLVIAGGISMLHLRRRWLALFAAYVAAGLSLAGCYGILFYPFGIWALIVLYRPDVRQEFGHRPVEPRDDD